MLAEAFIYLASLPATPPPFRRHLYDAIGLWARGMRQVAAWAPHIAETRGLLDTTIDEIATRRRVVALGAGPLFDVPLESLARTFGEVVLVDIAHLSTTRRRLARYRNIRREWRDLSGPNGLDFLMEMPELDWVISVNLLSQLARGAPAGDESSEVEAHLAGLNSLACRVTLVTDIDYRVIDRNGRIIEEADLLHGHPMPPPELRWKWEVAPFGEDAPDTRRVHTVAAWPDWRCQLARPGSVTATVNSLSGH